MKKLLLISVMALAFSFNAMANDLSIVAETVVVANQEKEFKKIDEAKVPAEILQEITTKYGGYSITEAAVSEDNIYRITVNKDSKTTKVYYTATGEFVKEEK